MIELVFLAKISAFRFHAIRGKYVLHVPGSWKSKRRHNSSGPWGNNVRSHSRHSQLCVAKVAQQFLLFTSVIPQLFWIRNIFFFPGTFMCVMICILSRPVMKLFSLLLRHGHCLFVFYYSLFCYFFRVCVFIFVILLSFIHV